MLQSVLIEPLTPKPMSIAPQATHKRKADERLHPDASCKENDQSSSSKITMNINEDRLRNEIKLFHYLSLCSLSEG
jgi:hypothetical protein